MFALAAVLSLIPSKPVLLALPKVGSVSAVRVADSLVVDICKSSADRSFGLCNTFRVRVVFEAPDIRGLSVIATDGPIPPWLLASVAYRDDTLFVSGTIAIPHKAIPFLTDHSEFNDKAVELAFGKGVTQEVLLSRLRLEPQELLFPKHRKPDFEPSDVPFRRGGIADGDPVENARTDYYRRARFHPVIRSADTVTLFHAVGDQLLVSDEPMPMEVPPKAPKPPPPRNLRTGSLPPELGANGFTAYPAGGRHYLVTGNGRVFVVEEVGKDKVSVKVVWNDPKRWVFGVYSDSDRAVYGFGYDGPFRKPDRFYFRFDPNPVAVSYKFTQKLADDAGKDGLAEAYECGRAVWKAQQKKK